MINKQVQCPKCQQVIPVAGNPGEIKIISCPKCSTRGKVSFPGRAVTKETAITVTNLRKEYDSLVAVNDISFSVQRGEVFGFLGPNGAGKTTTVEMIESIRKPTHGTITILGQDINTSFNAVKNHIGILPQEFHSFERLTVRETITYYAKLYEKHADIDEILAAMDLHIHEDKLYKELSGGLKQRVGVAISLVNDPDIIFLDEPTTGLDPKARREVWEVIAGLRNRGKTIFLTTHYMEEAEFLADHLAIIHQGKIIAEGTLDELINQYGKGNILHLSNCSHPDVESLLQQHGYDARKDSNGNVNIEIEYKDRILEILSILRRDAIEFEGIDIRRPNLEEIFLHLTGSTLREDTA